MRFIDKFVSLNILYCHVTIVDVSFCINKREFIL